MTLSEVTELPNLTIAEQQVLARLDGGEDIRIGDGGLPKAGDETRRVRAALVRLLLLNKDPKLCPREKGLRITGAWVTDKLNLEGCHFSRDLQLVDCRFDVAPVLSSASVDNLVLDGSVLPGLYAEAIETRGDVSLQRVNASGEVLLNDAVLRGSLWCNNAKFLVKNDAKGAPTIALSADGLRSEGSAYLRNVEATGKVRLLGAVIGGDLWCDEAKFLAVERAKGDQCPAFLADGLSARKASLFKAKTTGELSLRGSVLRGDLDCDELTFSPRITPPYPRRFLTLDGMRVEGTLSVRVGVESTGAVNLTQAGIVDLTGAEFGHIADDADRWPDVACLWLDRCRYGAFFGPVDAKGRLDWLRRQDWSLSGEGFWPQPYEQCARVLFEMGHGDAAREVLIEKERRQRAVRRARLAWWWRWVAGLRDSVLCMTIGFGQRPLRAFWWLFVLWFCGVGVFWGAYQAGAMLPAEAGAVASAGWKGCVRGAPAGLGGVVKCFLVTPEGRYYPPFEPILYSAETLLPVINLDQRARWRPDAKLEGGLWGGSDYISRHTRFSDGHWGCWRSPGFPGW